MFKKEKAFTLIEMLIVLAIISVLIILIVPNLTKKSKEVNDKGCDALVKVAQTQVNAYHLDHGNYPERLNDLVDDYLSNEQLTCPNGVELKYNNGKVSAS